MADITLQLTIPDQYITRVLNAFETLADKDIIVVVESEKAQFSYNYESKQQGETNRDFADRAIKECIRSIVRVADYIIDKERYDAEVTNISPAGQDVPDDIIT